MALYLHRKKEMEEYTPSYQPRSVTIGNRVAGERVNSSMIDLIYCKNFSFFFKLRIGQLN
jgi:hypothetical protein